MKIGTDISLNVCKHEGYMIMEYVSRELLVKGKLQKDARCEFYQYWPEYCMEEKGYTVIGDGRCMSDSMEGSYWTANGHQPMPSKQFCSWPKLLDECYSAQDIWELYLQDQESIDSVCGLKDNPHTFPTTPHELLHLTSDVACAGRMQTH